MGRLLSYLEQTTFKQRLIKIQKKKEILQSNFLYIKNTHEALARHKNVVKANNKSISTAKKTTTGG